MIICLCIRDRAIDGGPGDCCGFDLSALLRLRETQNAEQVLIDRSSTTDNGLAF